MNLAEMLNLVPPTSVALLIVIVWLFRCLEKKDKMIQSLGDIVHRNSDITNKLSALITILVQGRRP